MLHAVVQNFTIVYSFYVPMSIIIIETICVGFLLVKEESAVVLSNNIMVISVLTLLAMKWEGRWACMPVMAVVEIR